MRIFAIATSVVVVLAAAAWAAEDFTGTKELRLIQGDLGSPKAKTVVITDKAKIEKALGTIKLKRKEPCACDHVDHAVFVKDTGEITVSLCDHCFDVGQNTYVMPPEFYQLYRAYTQDVPAKSAGDVAAVGPAKAVVTESAKLSFDTYSGYFVSNKFEPDAAASFVVLDGQEQFDQVFGAAFVMRDKSHRLPKDAFQANVVLAVVKRGKAVWELKLESVRVEDRGVVLRYTAASQDNASASFACPLIVSIPRGEYTAVTFVENGKPVKAVKCGTPARD